jgi:hypothetical protein
MNEACDALNQTLEQKPIPLKERTHIPTEANA